MRNAKTALCFFLFLTVVSGSSCQTKPIPLKAGRAGGKGAAGGPAGIVIDGSQVLRQRPPGIGGVVINAHGSEFATNAVGIDFQGDFQAAKIKLARVGAYPDTRFPGQKLDWFDAKVKAILNAGAQPLFIMPLKPVPEDMQADGKPGGTPQTDLTFLVQHYQAAPFALKSQTWEVGNESDIGIDYHMTPEAYAAAFHACHDALTQAGLRQSVLLCGPVAAHAYHWPRPGQDDDIDYFLDHCRDCVDIVTYHNYAGAKTPDGTLAAPHKLDFMEDSARTFAVNPKTGQPKDVYGVAALLAKMKTVHFARPNVGIGITEHNTATDPDSVARGLWNLSVTHYYLYNPLGRLTTQFVFDDYGGQQGGLGVYDAQKKKRYGYWALWINGNRRGSEVLAQQTSGNEMPDGRPWLLVTATRDAAHLYVEVINRKADALRDRVILRGLTPTGPPTLAQMAQGVTPDKSSPTALTAPFDYEFPSLSATIFTFPLRP